VLVARPESAIRPRSWGEKEGEKHLSEELDQQCG